MRDSRLSIHTRVNSFYVHNAWTDTPMAGPFKREHDAANAKIRLDGMRYMAKIYGTVDEAWKGCDTRWGVWDTQEESFMVCAEAEDRLYVSDDIANIEYIARTLNDNARNDARLRWFQRRHPVTASIR